MPAATVHALPRRWPFHDAPIDLLTGIYSFVHENVALRHRLNPAAKPFAMKYQKFSPTMLEGFTNRYNALRLNGIDSDVLTRDQLKAMVPDLNYDSDARFPISGAVIQRRAGVARHDAVAWGFARAASRLGVDIIENCEVTDIDVDKNVVTGVRTSKGNVRCDKIGICVAGHTSEVARLAG